MPNDDLAFAKPIRTTRKLKPPLSLEIKTVDQAIDQIIDDLTEAEQAMPLWQTAREALFDAYYARPRRALKAVLPAEEAVRAALRAERSHVEPD